MYKNALMTDNSTPTRRKSLELQTRENYIRIVDYFISNQRSGMNIQSCAQALGLPYGTVRIAFHSGWPKLKGSRPIYQLVGFADRDGEIVTIEDRRKGIDRQIVLSAIREMLTNPPASVLKREPNGIGAKMKAATADAEEKMQLAEAMLFDAASRIKEAEDRIKGAEAIEKAAIEAAEARQRETDKEVHARLVNADKASQELMKERLLEAKKANDEKFQGFIDRAKVDQAEVMADEAAMVKFGRKAAVGAAAMAAIVLQEAQQMAMQVREALRASKDLPPRQLLELVKGLVILSKEAQKTVIYALQAERTRVGKPTDIIGVEFTEQGLAEQEIQVEALRIALEERREMEFRAQQVAGQIATGGSGEEVASGKPTLN